MLNLQTADKVWLTAVGQPLNCADLHRARKHAQWRAQSSP